MSKKNNPSKKGLRNLSVEEVMRLGDLVKSIPKAELPRIWNELNNHQWSNELGEPPASFIEDEYICKELHCIMNLIESECGYKALLRYFHVVERGDTEQMFEDWWDSHCLKVIENKQINIQPIPTSYPLVALIISITALLVSLAKLFLA